MSGYGDTHTHIPPSMLKFSTFQLLLLNMPHKNRAPKQSIQQVWQGGLWCFGGGRRVAKTFQVTLIYR